MSDFKTLKGLYIKHVSSDPSNLIEGQIWYNTTTQTLKVAPLISSWAAGGDLNTAREAATGFGDSDTLAVAATGAAVPNTITVNTETYDGSSWTESGNVSAGRRYAGGGGTQTAAVIFGGDTSTDNTGLTAVTEEWGGSSWTNSNNLSATARSAIGFGIQTAAVAVGGQTAPEALVTEVEEYNGSTWTAVTVCPFAQWAGSGCGTEAAGKVGGGRGPPGGVLSTVADYDGTNWTSAPSLINAIAQFGLTGTQTACLQAGADPGTYNSKASIFDGTSFSETADLGSGRYFATNSASGAGSTAGTVFGGGAPAATEEFSQTITARSVDTT